MNRFWRTSLLLAAAILAGGAGAPFYQGRQVVMVVASGAGGGYDTYARTLARYMPKYIPGGPAIVAKDVPGAGGLIAANSLYNATLADGLTFAALTNGAAMDPLFGEAAARFDGRRFNWLGSMGKLENICVTRLGAITNIEQARNHEVTVAASGATGNSAIAASSSAMRRTISSCSVGSARAFAEVVIVSSSATAEGGGDSVGGPWTPAEICDCG